MGEENNFFFGESVVPPAPVKNRVVIRLFGLPGSSDQLYVIKLLVNPPVLVQVPAMDPVGPD